MEKNSGQKKNWKITLRQIIVETLWKKCTSRKKIMETCVKKMRFERNIYRILHCILFQVFEFFKNQISRQYPFHIGEAVDPFVVSGEAHESFMKQRCEMVFGRSEILNSVRYTDQHFLPVFPTNIL